MEVRRGEIWWANLGVPAGAEPGYRRPVLIVQADAFNRSRIQTVVAAAVTSNLNLAEAPGNVRLSRRAVLLPEDSVVNVSQIVTLDRKFLQERAGRIAQSVLRRVEDGLRLVLSLQ
ncbi:MAG: type II toxin-antitoxin system PemK/MazF family toxin [Gammaproteobacteria bacterium]|nr:type II toxin-antitoxin system PemK/MazF family toxin [Gammaproteobacteria bacterium]